MKERGELANKENDMLIHHPADSRGKVNHGWLLSYHTFSFADYYDSHRMNFGALRVLNDDFIAPGMGFGTHPHRDMEIITIPLSGALQHKDSEGNSEIIKKGEVQIMSAGTGVYHSEFNASSSEPVSLLQIWVLPKKLGIRPRYEQKVFNLAPNTFSMIVSSDGRQGSLAINQDAFFSLAKLTGGSVFYIKQQPDNGLYVFVIEGSISIKGHRFHRRDGIGLSFESPCEIVAESEAEVLVMEVPMLKG
jgi:quercetin 2,3-dioxygenase